MPHTQESLSTTICTSLIFKELCIQISFLITLTWVCEHERYQKFMPFLNHQITKESRAPTRNCECQVKHPYSPCIHPWLLKVSRQDISHISLLGTSLSAYYTFHSFALCFPKTPIPPVHESHRPSPFALTTKGQLRPPATESATMSSVPPEIYM